MDCASPGHMIGCLCCPLAVTDEEGSRFSRLLLVSSRVALRVVSKEEMAWWTVRRQVT